MKVKRRLDDPKVRAVFEMKIGNIEFERFKGQLCIRKTSTPRAWPDRMLNTLVIEPSELLALRVLLDAIEEQLLSESNEPKKARRIAEAATSGPWSARRHNA